MNADKIDVLIFFGANWRVVVAYSEYFGGIRIS
jgi:hypothetical protein